jgi:hypothetical protein
MSKALNFNELLTDPEESFVPHLQTALVVRGHNLTPELLRFVGREQLKEFLLAFGGKNVTFPSWESMEGCVRDAYIMWRMAQVKLGTYAMANLCRETNLSPYHIRVKVEALEALINTDGRV